MIEEVDQVLGVFYRLPEDEEEVEIPPELQVLAEERDEARKTKDWAKADEIRDQIEEMGYALADSAEGTVIRKT